MQALQTENAKKLAGKTLSDQPKAEKLDELSNELHIMIQITSRIAYIHFVH